MTNIMTIIFLILGVFFCSLSQLEINKSINSLHTIVQSQHELIERDQNKWTEGGCQMASMNGGSIYHGVDCTERLWDVGSVLAEIRNTGARVDVLAASLNLEYVPDQTGNTVPAHYEKKKTAKRITMKTKIVGNESETSSNWNGNVR